MKRQRQADCRWARLTLLSALCFSVVPVLAAEPRPITGLLHNEDSTQFFFTQKIVPGKAGETIDRYVDVMANAGVTVFLCNTNSRRTNYQSRVWDSYWGSYDPAGPDDQPFLAPVPRNDVQNYRNLIGNMLAVHQQGIDYPARVIDRCRHNGISPWITLRMNDCHYNDIPAHPFHGSFWKKNPQFRRKNCTGYFATCLDYAHPEVRDFYRALITETLDRYDIDGIELDFLREPFLFSEGKEMEGTPILNEWMCEIRKLVDDAAAKRGHAIRMGVRVPSRPETAVAMGLDAITWAKKGWIDLLVAAPRWSTLEFDMPMQQWRQLLGTSKTTLAGGLEVNYRPSPGAPASLVSPELAAGAAVSVLANGADVVYLFNYFQVGHPNWSPPVYQKTLSSMCSLDSLLKLPRCVGITYRDIIAPGEPYQAPLPTTGNSLTFRMKCGPVADNRRRCDLQIGFSGEQAATMPLPAVSLDGQSCELLSDETKEGLRSISWKAPPIKSSGNDVHEIKILAKGSSNMTIQRVEAFLHAPPI